MIRIAGITPLTSIDFPGRLAAVLFLQGCPWRCSYCHNPDLQPARADGGVAWDDVEAFLRRRRGLLDGVVFSGGEPTMQAALPQAIAQVKALGYQVGVHTAGMYPQRLRQLLPLLDWVGLDVKATPACHDAVIGRRNGAVRARESLELVLASGVEYECRTTWSSALFPLQALYALADTLADIGVSRWVLQASREPDGTRVMGERPDLQRLGARFGSFAYREG